jgi:hypothetical protein
MTFSVSKPRINKNRLEVENIQLQKLCHIDRTVWVG